MTRLPVARPPFNPSGEAGVSAAGFGSAGAHVTRKQGAARSSPLTPRSEAAVHGAAAASAPGNASSFISRAVARLPTWEVKAGTASANSRGWLSRAAKAEPGPRRDPCGGAPGRGRSTLGPSRRALLTGERPWPRAIRTRGAGDGALLRRGCCRACVAAFVEQT